MKVFRGRPDDIENRLKKEVRVYDFLDSHKMEYERIDHEAAYTMQDCYKIRDMLGILDCKNLFLCNRQMTDFYVLMLPGEKKLKTKLLAKEIGTARLSFAPPEKMEEYLDITPGSLSIMGLMNDKNNHVQLLIDKEVLEEEYIGCHPCVNTSSLKLKTRDVLEKFLPAVSHGYQVVELNEV